MKPTLVDLFCKAGGCTKGYQRAGFYVVGVDIEPQPHYCGDEFVQADALEFSIEGFDEKAAWLVRHFGSEWERRLIIAPDKSMVRGDILLDDAPYLEWLERAPWRTVIFPMSWNGEGSKWAGHPRWSWGDPVDELLALVVAS